MPTAHHADHQAMMQASRTQAIAAACPQPGPLPPPGLPFPSENIAAALTVARWKFRQACAGLEPSMAFVAVDPYQADMPVILVSDGFEDMTGYSRGEILGKNCRFLQYPPITPVMLQQGQRQQQQQQQQRSPDHFKDSHATGNMDIQGGEEAASGADLDVESTIMSQHNVPSYRKGGGMFMNSVTIIPVLGGSAGSSIFFGFSTDNTYIPRHPMMTMMGNIPASFLVRRRKGRNKRKQLPSPYPDPVGAAHSIPRIARPSPDAMDVEMDFEMDLDMDFNMDFDMDTLASAPPSSTTDTPSPAKSWEFGDSPAGSWPLPEPIHEMLLDYLGGIILVVSLQGLIHYATPSAGSGLAGQSLLEICHGADKHMLQCKLAAIASSLMTSSALPPHDHEQDLLFRLRGADGTYTWLGCTGTPLLETPKRLVLLSCYPQQVSRLPRDLVVSYGGGFGDRDLWLRISPSGLVLAVLSPMPAVLDLAAGSLGAGAAAIGFQDLLAAPDIPRFQEVLALLDGGRGGNVVVTTFRLNTTNKYDLRATVSIYPDRTAPGATFRSAILQCKVTRALHDKADTRIAPLPVVSRGGALASKNWLDDARTSVHGNRSNTSNNSNSNTSNNTSPNPTTTDDDYDDGDDDDDIMAGLSAARCGNSHLEAHRLQAQNAVLRAEVERLEAAARQRRRMKRTPGTNTNTNTTNTTNSSGHSGSAMTMITTTTTATGTSTTTTSTTNNTTGTKGLGRDGGGGGGGRTLYQQLMREGCANCHARESPEWRKGPSGQRDLCNRCGLRWAKGNKLRQDLAVAAAAAGKEATEDTENQRQLEQPQLQPHQQQQGENRKVAGF